MGLVVDSYRFAAAAAFSPTDVTGCTLWLDAADTATITDSGGAVSAWADKSSQSITMTATGGPTTGSRTLNGENVIDFDGTDDQFTSSASFLLVNSSDGTFTAFAVTVPDAGGSRFVLSQDTGSGTRMPQYVRLNAGLYRTTRIAGSILADESGQTTTLGNTYLAVVTHTASGAAVELTLNGSTDGSTAGTGSNGAVSAAVRVGHENSSNRWDGAIAEIIVYDSIISSGDRTSVEDYLTAKWGI